MKTSIPLNAVAYANLSIGRDLKRMREEAGFSQVDVAREATIRAPMLCRIEAGQGNPTVGTITKIVKAINRLSKRAPQQRAGQRPRALARS